MWPKLLGLEPAMNWPKQFDRLTDALLRTNVGGGDGQGVVGSGEFESGRLE